MGITFSDDHYVACLADIQYFFRSSIYAYTDAQLAEAKSTMQKYGEELAKKGKGEITTEIKSAAEAPFYYAEDYHQQYLHTNPGGYCSMRGTGVKCVD